MRLIFMGTPQLARTCLARLLESGVGDLIAVVTQPDRPKGRNLQLQPSPVKVLASEAGVPFLQPERARDNDFITALKEAKPDLIAVAAYGQILPPAILDLAKHGCLNVHTSLLPKYRGAAPIQWSILNGDSETGVTIMKMDAGLDTGAIVAQEKIAIDPQETSGTLHDRLALVGAGLLIRTIPDYVAGILDPQPQPLAGVSHAPKIRKEDGKIDWSLPAGEIERRVRGLSPWPGAFTFLPGGGGTDRPLLKIWQASLLDQAGLPGQILEADKTRIVVACGIAALELRIIQKEGGKKMAAGDFLAGHQLSRGMQLG